MSKKCINLNISKKNIYKYVLNYFKMCRGLLKIV